MLSTLAGTISNNPGYSAHRLGLANSGDFRGSAASLCVCVCVLRLFLRVLSMCLCKAVHLANVGAVWAALLVLCQRRTNASTSDV